MDQNALARSNYLFFYVELPKQGLFNENFSMLCKRGAHMAALKKKRPAHSACEDDVQQLPFQCNDGEFGYLRFRNEDAELLEELDIDGLSLATKIPLSIKGDRHEICDFVLPKKEVRVTFKIVGYEGDLGAGCTEIKDPIAECPDEIPLGRMVEMAVCRT